MGFTLSLSTNPLVNRFAEPEDLVGTLAEEIGIGHVQLTHEFINPAWPVPLIRRLTDRMARVCARSGLKVTSMMTGPYGRLNHFGHPDAEVRRYYVDWFKSLADIAADLGCPAIGTQFAILTYRDFDDAGAREKLVDEVMACWGEVATYAAGKGLDYLFWEPMSVAREFGHTLAHTQALQDVIDASNMALPPQADGRHRPRRRRLATCRRCRSLRLGHGIREPVADHPHQAELDEQGRPLALHPRP